MNTLHQRFSAVAQDLRNRGEEDLATWIQKHIAAEQRVARKPSGFRISPS